MKPETIQAEGIRLRPPRDTDAEDLAAGLADPLSLRFLPALPAPYTLTDAGWWITEGAPAAWADGGAAYAVADPRTDRLLGGVNLTHPVIGRGQVEISYWAAPWARGRGVARTAVRVLTAHAFASGFSRVELLTHAENAASQRVALAAGFQWEGVRRAAALRRDGGRDDLVVWVRVAGDPIGPTPRVLPDLPPGGLTDGVVTLRPLNPADVDFMYELHTLPEVVASRVPPVAPDRAAIARRCALAESRWLAGQGADLVIVDAASGTAAGGCALTPEGGGQAMIGYSVLPAWRGRGLAPRTVHLLARWAFGSAGIARLSAGTLPGNTGSQRVLEKVGFRPEGVLRGRLPALGATRADGVMFGLLPEDLHDVP